MPLLAARAWIDLLPEELKEICLRPRLCHAFAATALLLCEASLRAQTGALPQGPTAVISPTRAAPGAVPDRVYLGQDLFVPRGQMIRNATCVFCSVQVEGEATGHVLVLFGNLSVTGRIARHAAVIGGNAVFDGQARVAGWTAVLFGNLVYETEDVLSGSAYVLGGHSSSYAARAGLRRRLALSPKLVSTMALLGFTLLLLAGVGARQRHRGARHV